MQCHKHDATVWWVRAGLDEAIAFGRPTAWKTQIVANCAMGRDDPCRFFTLKLISFMLRVWPDPDPKIWWYRSPRSASRRYALPGEGAVDSVAPNAIRSGTGSLANSLSLAI